MMSLASFLRERAKLFVTQTRMAQLDGVMEENRKLRHFIQSGERFYIPHHSAFTLRSLIPKWTRAPIFGHEKLAKVKDVKQKRGSLKLAAATLGVNPSTIYRWRKRNGE